MTEMDRSGRIQTALVPCAGLGTRLLPMTRVVPKELLPYGDRPLMEHILEELHDAGIRRVVIVVRPDKDLLRRHLAEPYPFQDRAHCPAGVPEGMEVRFAEQTRADGFAGALHAARPFVDEPFLLVFPDQILAGASRQLCQAWTGEDSLSSVIRLSAEDRGYFEGARAMDLRGEGPLFDVVGLSDAEGELRGFGRTILKPSFFEGLEDDPADASFGRAFVRFLGQGTHRALLLQGSPADLGTRAGYRHYAAGGAA